MARKFQWRFQEKLRLLLVDAVFYIATAAVLFHFLAPGSSVTVLFQSPGFLFIVFNVLVWNYVFGNYEIEIEKNVRTTFLKTILVSISVLLIVTFFNYIAGKERSGVFGRGVLAGSLLVFWVYLQASRSFLSRLLQSSHEMSRWVFVTDPQMQEVVSKDLKTHRLPMPIDWVTSANQDLLLKESSSLLGVVFSTRDRDPSVIETLMNIRMKGLTVFDLVDFYETYFQKIPVFYLSSDFFSFSKGFSILGNSMLQRLKRLSDIFIAILILIPALPVMAIVALLVKLESSGPALYSQVRTGKDGREFTLFKFRSMRKDAEAKGAQWAQVNDSRVTRLGKILRKTRLDELPQLWNILKGDMSFVGPRPERPEFNHQLEQDLPFYQLRHLVRPGLTGWAQVNYPYGASKEDALQKLQYDLFYVKNFTLLLDLQIILKTIRVVVLGQGR